MENTERRGGGGGGGGGERGERGGIRGKTREALQKKTTTIRTKKKMRRKMR